MTPRSKKTMHSNFENEGPSSFRTAQIKNFEYSGYMPV
jgi:hypothetical protein